MASNSETGHAINISNFRLLIDRCTALGVSYNPSNAALSVANMTTLWNNARTAHVDLTNLIQASKDEINARQILFAPTSKLVTRTFNYFKSTKASKQIKQDVKGLADKYRGIGLAAKKLPNGLPDPNDVSRSHQSYVMRGDTFRQLVALYGSSAFYAPNEADLSIAELTDLSDDMQTLNDAIGTIVTPIDTLRITRNNLMYTIETGMIDIALSCKSYAVGLLGTGSAAYKAIVKLSFRRFYTLKPEV